MMMSIDVGIKNLSFVIFDTAQAEDNSLCIQKDANDKLLWNILDITPPAYNFFCTHKTRTGKLCGKSSVIKYRDHPESYCNLHKKHMRPGD